MRLLPLLVPLCAMVPAQAARSQTTTSPVTASVAFGQVNSLYSDLTSRQSVCAFGSMLGQAYSLLATGSGAGGAFTVSNGSTSLPYELQWAQTAGASSGTDVKANVSLAGQNEAGILVGVGCALGINTATVIVIIRSTSLQQARAGNYSGTLFILLTAQ